MHTETGQNDCHDHNSESITTVAVDETQVKRMRERKIIMSPKERKPKLKFNVNKNLWVEVNVTANRFELTAWGKTFINIIIISQFFPSFGSKLKQK